MKSSDYTEAEWQKTLTEWRNSLPKELLPFKLAAARMVVRTDEQDNEITEFQAMYVNSADTSKRLVMYEFFDGKGTIQ